VELVEAIQQRETVGGGLPEAQSRIDDQVRPVDAGALGELTEGGGVAPCPPLS
jgi:hypothetical protein